jgi:hypothetical protein
MLTLQQLLASNNGTGRTYIHTSTTIDAGLRIYGVDRISLFNSLNGTFGNARTTSNTGISYNVRHDSSPKKIDTYHTNYSTPNYIKYWYQPKK